MRNDSIQPSYNLAFEEAIYDYLSPTEDNLFFFWQNAPSVIFGTSQVPEDEADIGYCKRSSIQLVRRSTGGGAVYHDLGNLNFSFFLNNVDSHKNGYEEAYKILKEPFQSMGIEISLSPTNDLLFDGRKFSGMASRIHRNRMLVHGTILYDVDMEEMTKALSNPNGKFVQSKGVKSRHAEVINLKPYLKGISSIIDLKQKLESLLIEKYSAKELIIGQKFLGEVIELAKTKFKPLKIV